MPVNPPPQAVSAFKTTNASSIINAILSRFVMKSSLLSLFAPEPFIFAESLYAVVPHRFIPGGMAFLVAAAVAVFFAAKHLVFSFH